MVRILGGGPAGSCAAIAAALGGASVEISERSHFPRHKVCGEFISPGILPVLERLGVVPEFAALHPFRVRRMAIHVRNRTKQASLDEPAFGLSRYHFDHLLWTRARSLGVMTELTGPVTVVATGRPRAAKGNRLFGFKAHFEGPTDDAVELFFGDDAYVGVNCIETGLTNVCGLVREHRLREVRFDPDALVADSPALQARLAPLRMSMKWLFTGAIAFGQRWEATDAFHCGDALSFVDPFTGSGLLCAAITGASAGSCAARGLGVEAYVRGMRYELEEPFLYASVLRRLLGSSWAETLLPFAPGRLLFRLTRPG